MSDFSSREPMLEMYIHETRQMIESLEQIMLDSEQSSDLQASIGEIFRIMHTIKGSSAMMLYDGIATTAHQLEDLFFYLREEKPDISDYTTLTDLVLASIDFISGEVEEIEAGREAGSDYSHLSSRIQECLEGIKGKQPGSLDSQEEAASKPAEGERLQPPRSREVFYVGPERKAEEQLTMFHARVFFEEHCEMENVRAYLVVHNLQDKATEISYEPSDIMDNDGASGIIKAEGFCIHILTSMEMPEISDIILKTAFVRDVEIDYADTEPEPDGVFLQEEEPPPGGKVIMLDDFISESPEQKPRERKSDALSKKQAMISVSVDKLDKLMNLVGELVVAESMVTQDAAVQSIKSENYHKAARQLSKITKELQDVAMSTRLVPLSVTFQKMNRLVRDMSKKVNKNVSLIIQGEETEVDKNVIDNISDPLMHIIRNAIDHGIEGPADRTSAGKKETGNIWLQASNAGGDVWITVRDDGRGLERQTILEKAREKGLLQKAETEYSDKEAFALILQPGFSTKEAVTEFSGRGVGMDVVLANVQKMSGTISIDSVCGQGSTFAIKIPLTLGIIDGITVKVGATRMTIPVTCICESFRIRDHDLITDPDDNEMIVVRGECFEVRRIHRLYRLPGAVEDISQGMIMMVEHDRQRLCLMVDDLIGQQQVVIKPLPEYVKQRIGRVAGIAGCAMLGDGTISLVVDVGDMIAG